MKKITTVLLFIFVFLIIFSCSENNTSEFDIEIPKIVETAISIEDGQVSNGLEVITLKKNDQVKLTFTSNNEIEIHLHGYDIKNLVKPNETSVMEFKAIATGRYNVTSHSDQADGNHHNHDHSDHGALFESKSLLLGDFYSYQVPADFTDFPIVYHDHMEHKTIGTIEISKNNQSIDEVKILITEKPNSQTLVFDPDLVFVNPGTKIIWENKLARKVRITSGPPPSVSKHSGHHDEETTLFRIEVYP